MMYSPQSMVRRVALVCIVVFSTSLSYARGVGLTENPPSQPDPIGSTGQPPGNIVYPPSQPNVPYQPSGINPPSNPNTGGGYSNGHQPINPNTGVTGPQSRQEAALQVMGAILSVIKEQQQQNALEAQQRAMEGQQQQYGQNANNVRQASQTSCLGWALTTVGGKIMCTADENGNLLPEPIPFED